MTDGADVWRKIDLRQVQLYLAKIYSLLVFFVQIKLLLRKGRVRWVLWLSQSLLPTRLSFLGIRWYSGTAFSRAGKFPFDGAADPYGAAALVFPVAFFLSQYGPRRSGKWNFAKSNARIYCGGVRH
jgi:hypothetical protein